MAEKLAVEPIDLEKVVYATRESSVPVPNLKRRAKALMASRCSASLVVPTEPDWSTTREMSYAVVVQSVGLNPIVVGVVGAVVLVGELVTDLLVVSAVGATLGDVVGNLVPPGSVGVVGDSVVGAFVGLPVGAADGVSLGCDVGAADGEMLGCEVGAEDGETVGRDVGILDGETLGRLVGASVGCWVG